MEVLWLVFLFTWLDAWHELTHLSAEMLPKMDMSWGWDDPLPSFKETDRSANYGVLNVLTAYIFRKVFIGDSSFYKAGTFRKMSRILSGKFEACGDLPEIPYISRATIAYVHCLVLHSPFYARENKGIRGKIEDYYMSKMEDMNKICDEDFESGLHELFKDHFKWIVKDPRAGYDPDADMYDDKPTAPPP